MNARAGSETSRAILLFEPRVEGHHLSWMRAIAASFVSGGYNITLACRYAGKARERIDGEFGDLMRSIQVVPTHKADGSLAGRSVSSVLRKFAAQQPSAPIFLCNFDEIASALLRKAAFGVMPPAEFRGRLGGIYHRPTFLLGGGFPANRWIKSIGFRRLVKGGWLSTLMFLDEFLVERLKKKYPPAPFWRLATPGPGVFDIPRDDARRALSIPADRKVFLFYGGPYRRKGLHLAVAAFENMAAKGPEFLLCAGEQGNDQALLSRLHRLEAQGKGMVLSRYVSAREESLCFCASDAVLLPYIGHLISSGVMAQACAAGRPVIVSNDGLMARRARQYDLGRLFSSGSVSGLQKAIEGMAERFDVDGPRWRKNALAHAAENSQEAFSRQLLEAMDVEMKMVHV